MATVAAILSLLVFAVTANVVPASLIRMAETFAIDAELLANVSAVQFTGFFATTIVAGYVGDCFGKKTVFLLACLLTAAGGAVCAVSQGVVPAYAGCFLMGCGGGVLEGQSSALLADLHPGRRKLMLNVSQAVYCVGAIGGPAIMGFLLPKGISWRLFFVSIAVMSLALLLLYWCCSIPPRHREDRIRPDVLKRIVVQRDFLLPCVILFLYVLAETSVVVFVNPYLRKVMGAPESWAIYSISIFWGTMIVGRILCAFIPEGVSTPNVVSALMTLTALSMLAQLWAASWPVSLLFFALSGFFCAGVWPLITEISASRYPRYIGTVLGITIAAGALGCVFAPPLGSLLLRTLPSARVFPLMGAFMLVGAVLARLEHGAERSAAIEPQVECGGGEENTECSTYG